jgi:hypothetical protein
MSEVIDIEKAHGRGNLAYHLNVRGFQSRGSDISPRPAASKRGGPSSPVDNFAADPFPDDIDAALVFAGSSNGQYAAQQGASAAAAAAAAAAGGSSADSAKRTRH